MIQDFASIPFSEVGEAYDGLALTRKEDFKRLDILRAVAYNVEFTVSFWLFIFVLIGRIVVSIRYFDQYLPLSCLLLTVPLIIFLL